MPNGFARLPTELKAAIIGEVRDIKTLRNLARCSSLCYQLVLPYLYGDIQLTHYHHRVSHRYDDAIRHAYKLTCVLLSDPVKAACVRSLTVVRKYIQQPPHAPSIIKQRFYAPGIKRKNLDRYILDLVPPGECDKHGNHPWFTAFAECRDSSVALLILLPRLPSLNHVCIATWLPSAYCSRLLQPRSSSVSSLSLQLLETPMPSILPYVNMCQQLRVLELEWVSGCFAWESDGLLWPQPNDLNDLLLGLRGELESLSLVYKRAMCSKWHSFPAPLTPLSRFPKLKVIKIGAAFILGIPANRLPGLDPTPNMQKLISHLPPQVESLHVVHNSSEDFSLLLKNFAPLVAAASENRRFASLRSILVEHVSDKSLAYIDGKPRQSSRKKYFPGNKSSMVAMQRDVEELGIAVRWLTTFPAPRLTEWEPLC